MLHTWHDIPDCKEIVSNAFDKMDQVLKHFQTNRGHLTNIHNDEEEINTNEQQNLNDTLSEFYNDEYEKTPEENDQSERLG